MRLALGTGLLAVALVLGALLPRERPPFLDDEAARVVRASVGPGVGYALHATSDALAPPWSYALGALVALGVLRARGRRAALYVALTVAATLALAYGLKRVTLRLRPAAHGENAAAPRSAHAYPSGHVAFTAAALGGVAVVFAAGRARTVRLAAAGGVLAATAWVALARVHLQRHHLTDTLGGALIGLGVVLVLSAWRGGRRSGLIAPRPARRTGTGIGTSH